MTRTTVDHPHIYKRVPVRTHGVHHPVAVVWHCTVSPNIPGAKDALAIPNFWNAQGLGYGAHLVIDGEGHTVKCALDKDICWAVAGSNTGRLHIEFVGEPTYTQAQWLKICDSGLKEGAKWTAWWCHQYDIPTRTSTVHGIATHKMYSDAYHNSDHTDPGPGFPYSRMIDRVRYYYKNGWVL